MISLDAYLGPYRSHLDVTPGMIINARQLLVQVNALLEEYASDAGNRVPDNPVTGTQISGSGNGGFRPRKCKVGAKHSAHKEALAADVTDPADELDDWLSTFDENDGADNAVLKKYGLFREHPSATTGVAGKGGWCHLTTRAPGSMRRTFQP